MNFFPLKLARNYVFSGKNAIEVNVISWIAFLALGFVTACLVVVLSVFAGLESINLQFYSHINPELKIYPSKGKSLEVNGDLLKTLDEFKKAKSIQTYSKVLEEKAYIQYNDKSHIVTIKGVDSAFNSIFALDTTVKIGNPLSVEFPQEVIVGAGVSNRLSMYVNPEEPIELLVPKPGKGMITNQENAFNAVTAYSTGIFFINDKYDNFIFAPLALTQDLLGYKPYEASAIEIKSEAQNINQLKQEIQQKIGTKYDVKTRQELDAAFLKMMNTENLIIYLIFVLILVIASFNLAGSVAIIILDKRKDAKTLQSMGMTIRQLRATHFMTGVLITVYALIFGLVIGFIVAYLQQKFGLVSISANISFPVKFTWSNFIIISFSVLIIGTFVSWFVSRNINYNQ